MLDPGGPKLLLVAARPMVQLQCRQHELLVPHQALFAMQASIIYVEEMPRIATLLKSDDRLGCK